MKFINNTEKYSYLKGDWPLVDISSDGKTIYMGKTNRPDAADDDNCWFIKLVTFTIGDEGNQIITTKFSDPNMRWSERHSLTYKYQ